MIGQTIDNRYKITEEAGQDFLTRHYKAQDLTENKPVFACFLKSKAKQRPLETMLRFKREIELVSHFNHPNLVKILAQGEFEGQDYIIKEYFDAKALSTYLGQALPADMAVEILLQVSSALDVAHQHDILHQALQPQSIYTTQDLKIAKLTNFGCNLLTDISRITETTEIINTFGYLSPESSGILRKPIDARSDIYSLGILFYQLLTGRLPYIAEDIAGLIHQHIATKPQAPSKLNSQIPPVLDNITLRLIAKEPQERYQGLKGLIHDLKEYQKQRKEGKELVDFEIARSDRLAQLLFTTKLIGRDKELGQLNGLLGQTKQGQGGFSFIFGEPGIGKSRLVDELRGSIHSLNGLFCGGKCYQFEFKTPYKVFSEAIDAYIEKVKRLSVQEQQLHINRIKDTLGELGGEIVKISPSITELIGQPSKLAELEPEKEKIRFLITVTNFLTSLSSSEAPLLMFLDDLQWADDGSLEILERFAEKIQNTSTLFIASYRDNEVDSGHPLAQLIKKFKDQQIPLFEIPVRLFSSADTAQMISQIIMEKEDSALPLANELQERAKGNPFFTLELLHSLVDSKVIYLKDDHYIYDLDKLKVASLPTSIVDAVLKRMSDLSEGTLKILSYASVMGKELNFRLLTELTGQQSDQILASIEEGIKNQLLYRDLTGQENVFFMHDRIREAFYQRLPPEERVPLHKRVAEVLEEQNKNNLDAVLYELAYHFTQGKVENKALQYAIPAAHKAKSAYANTLAIELYDYAKEILERNNNTGVLEYAEVLENLGEVYRILAKYDNALEALKACMAQIPANDKIHRAKVLSQMGDTLFEKGEVDQGAQVIGDALKILGSPLPRSTIGAFLLVPKEFSIQMAHRLFPDMFIRKKAKEDKVSELVAHLLNRIAYFYYFTDIIKSFYVMLKGLNIAEKKLGPTAETTHLYINMIPIWSSMALFNFAFRDVTMAINMAKELELKTLEGCAHAYSALAERMANKPQQSQEATRKSKSILKGLGEYWDLGVAYIARHMSNVIMGKFREDVEDTSEFYYMAKEANALQILGWAVYARGRIHSYIGDITPDNIEDIKHGLDLLKITRDKPNIIWGTSFLAFVYLRSGDYARAIEKIEEAVQLFPTHYNMGGWILDLFPEGAQIYLDAVINTDLSPKQRKAYLKRARWFREQSWKWSLLFKYFLGWSLQVDGTYYWLTGRKRKAVKTWGKALNWLRANKNNPGGDKYRIAYILLEEARFLLQDNARDQKALTNLLEAKELFSSMGCKLDLKACNDLLAKIMPSGEGMESREALTQRRHLESLLSTTRAIGSVFVLDDLLSKVMDYALKVTGAERGFLLLYDDKTNQLTLKLSNLTTSEVYLRGVPGSFSFEACKLSLELIKEAEKAKDVILASLESSSSLKIQSELKAYNVKQALAAYLTSRDKPIGILYLDNQLAGGTFGKQELELMQSFAVQASVSIENAYLVNSLVEQERLKQEMELGHNIQMALLPKVSPNVEGIRVSGLMLPAKEIGGDYYDFVPIPEKNNLVVVIGDVSGKGVGAGLLMSMVKATIHALSAEEESPKNILLRINKLLYQNIGAEKFMTLLYFIWRPQNRTLSYSSAGHEHIIIYRTAALSIEIIQSGGFMLGMMPGIDQFLEDQSIQLNSQDKIVLYTDGVTEARNPQEELFGLKRLTDLVFKYGHKPANELLGIIKQEVYTFISTREQYDDITLVVMEAT